MAISKPPHFHFHFSLLLLYTLFHFSTSLTSNPDTQPLLSFKRSADSTNSLSSWNQSTHFCSWYGVSCLQNRVSKLVLEDLSLHGNLPTSLLSLSHLRVLSLKHNQFSGPLPDLSSLSSLKLLFLSYNNFSGSFPLSVTSIYRLYRLDLSHNSFSGVITQNVNRLTHLLTLRLEENAFSGQIFGLDLPNIQDFNVSGNKLSGEIPKFLASFPESVFSDNLGLCGPPLLNCKEVSNDPTKPGNDAVAPPVGPTTAVISSSPVPTMPSKIYPTVKKSGSNRGRMSMWAIIAIIVGDVLVLASISLLLYCYFWRTHKSKRSGTISGGEKIVYSASPYPNGVNGLEKPGQMVFFEGGKKFELEDLLRASAEMLGKGVFGTAYKAVLDDGNVVAVKRLKEAQVSGKKDFEQQMEVLGRLRHPNLVSLKAYYFARDEKLLVFDYLPNASLFWLLHGNRGPGRTPLDWTTRLKIAAGAARGVAFIHDSCKALKLIHGNIKSTNILIDKAGNACVSDFGLSSFVPASTINSRSNGYRAPETLDGRRLTQKADVYSFGVLLLELLTGKYPSIVEGSGPYGTVGVGGVVDLPRWVQSVVREEWTAEVFDLELMRYKDIEEEMVGLLQIAMACTSASSDQRPRMSQVLKMIAEIRGVEVSPSHDNFDSESPSVSEDTTGGVSQ
ncbi:probable leucine-rich repeat receptor-like protein kinase At1g68400 [Amaranthus tricolor]|uniref:probable leucine-rich repeat receptor-like protein kinase At1g68400 n=1 Tax=Amaranthus tricolor TaxID=29722 RepID=UPI0025878AE0|nr:probable leucine-rich repeat receptor-like protein kinase At1g68400 [Amaranthus tricolor]